MSVPQIICCIFFLAFEFPACKFRIKISALVWGARQNGIIFFYTWLCVKVYSTYFYPLPFSKWRLFPCRKTILRSDFQNLFVWGWWEAHFWPPTPKQNDNSSPDKLDCVILLTLVARQWFITDQHLLLPQANNLKLEPKWEMFRDREMVINATGLNLWILLRG